MLSDTISTDTYYKTKGDAVKWKQNIPSQHSCTLAVNIIDVDSVGPAQLVSQSLPVTCITCYLHWDASAFKLKLPVSYIEMLLLYATKSTMNTINKIPEILCELFQRLDRSSKEEVLAFMELLYLSGGRKCYQQPMGDLYDSKFIWRLLYLVIGCCCW